MKDHRIHNEECGCLLYPPGTLAATKGYLTFFDRDEAMTAPPRGNDPETDAKIEVRGENADHARPPTLTGMIYLIIRR